MRLTRGDRVLITDQEHEGGCVGWQYRARRDGVFIDTFAIAPSDHDPAAIVQRFAAAITRRTRIISVSHVITSTGLRMPIAELAALATRHGIFCIVDGAQALGQIDVNVKALGCHAYATAGHKWLMGPKGTGLLDDREALVQWHSALAAHLQQRSRRGRGAASHPTRTGLTVAAPIILHARIRATSADGATLTGSRSPTSRPTRPALPCWKNLRTRSRRPRLVCEANRRSPIA